MTEYVEVITLETSIEEAARQMRSLDAGVLPVCDGDCLVGMLTDRDVTIRVVADGRESKDHNRGRSYDSAGLLLLRGSGYRRG
jgi:CBS domain-containing protein